MTLAVREPESEEKPQKYLNEKQQVSNILISCTNCNDGTTCLALVHSAFLLTYVIIFVSFRKTKIY